MAKVIKPTIAIFDNLTGELIERDMTADELAQREADLQIFAARQAEKKAKATARASALAKLKELGLTEAEIAAL